MKNLLAILAIAIAIPTMGFAEGEGRYQMLDIKTSYTGSIYVLDTKTGKIAYCYLAGGGDSGSVPRCSEEIATAFKAN